MAASRFQPGPVQGTRTTQCDSTIVLSNLIAEANLSRTSSITPKNAYIAGRASFSNLHTCVRRRSTQHECLGLLVSHQVHECQPYFPDEDRRLTEAPDRH